MNFVSPLFRSLSYDESTALFKANWCFPLQIPVPFLLVNIFEEKCTLVRPIAGVEV